MRSVAGVTLFVLVIALVIVGSRLFNEKPKSEPSAVHPVTESYPNLYVSSPPGVEWQSLLDDYDQYFNDAIRRNLASGVAVAVVKDTSILFLRTYGISDYNSGDTININSIFRLGSVSKCFASVVTGRLVDQGLLSWDDKVTDYVPGFKLKSAENTQLLTIRHLLSHTSGLPYHAFTDRVDEGANLDTLIYHLRDLTLTGPPGQLYSYQNVAYSLTGKVIEAATKKTYAEIVSREIFKPLNMLEASMSYDELIKNDHKTQPHVYSRKGWRAMKISQTYYNVGPAGGVNASISDMVRFLRALNGPAGDFLKEETLEEIFKPYVKATARNRNFRRWKRSKGSYYGLGWRVLTFKDDTVNYHGGYVNGYRAEIAISRKDHIGICVLVNCAGNLADNAIPEFLIRYDRMRKELEHNTAARTVAP